MKTIIEMAREAGLIVDANQSGFDSVEAFAALVRADERKKWEDQTDVEIHEAILDERKAILAIEASSAFNRMYGEFCPKAKDLADAIRARGNT